jgi:hypothetical protein
MPKNEDLLMTFNEAVQQQIKEIDELMLPLLKEYVNSVRTVRMTLSSEVVLMTQTTANFKELTKLVPQLNEFLNVVVKLREALTPEMMVVLTRLTNGANDGKENT